MLYLAGYVRRPVVSFIPNWNKIFTGESITMTCDIESAGEDNMVFYWFKDDNWVHTGRSYTIQQAETSHSGNYQCQTSTSEKSDSASLDIYNYYVILQAPVYVYEGDNVTLRCHHYPGYATRQAKFYKDLDVVQDWKSKSELLVENVDMNSVWRYTCTKEVYRSFLYYQHSDEVTISVQELFMTPVLRLTEGDNVTLTCDTSLAPLRATTQLEFVFYRNGRNVQDFSPANTFIVEPAWLKNSDTYRCQVRTAANTVVKTSGALAIEVGV
ncbi:Fc receptor-like protein 5 [Gastrophryne carolinensis]